MKAKIDVKKVAKLANLFITDDEEKMLDSQLESTIEHIESLSDINTDHIVGTNEVTDLNNVAREDVVTPSLSQKDALKNAKKTYNGFFVVPVIIEEAVEE
jgi:aspartyl/glutamyl-tRNA(Asn/Gln) amidotransferase C subunit